MLFLHVTTRIEGRANDSMLMDVGQKLGGPVGFPTMAWMDDTGEILTRQGDRSVEGFAKTGGLLTRRVELQKKSAAGDKVATIDLKLLECELGILEFADLEEALTGKDLSDAQKTQLETLRIDAEIDDMFAILRAQRGSETAMKTAGKEFVKFHKKGLKPSDASKQINFYFVIFQYSMMEKDTTTASAALDQLEPRLASNERAKPWLVQQRTAVKKMIEDAKTAEKKDGCGEGCGGGCGCGDG